MLCLCSVTIQFDLIVVLGSCCEDIYVLFLFFGFRRVRVAWEHPWSSVLVLLCHGSGNKYSGSI